MNLTVIGISHKTAPIHLREKLSFPLGEIEEILKNEKEVSPRELAILSTCNRTEIYSYASHAEMWAEQFLANHFGEKDLAPFLYIKREKEAVEHLFKVASGLDSLVLGETEILKQVKDAYTSAHKVGSTGKLFNVLFQRALYVGKFIRTYTSIGEGPLSVGGVAVCLAEKIFGDLHHSTVLIFGAGKMASVSSKYLLSKKVKRLYVANRTLETAQLLAKELNACALTLEEGINLLSQVDIVLSSVSGTQYLLTKERIQKLMGDRHNRSLFIIDISVPRSMDPAAHGVDNVYLYNIDDLEGIVQENSNRRSQELSKANKIAEEKSDEFFSWVQSLKEGEEKSLKHSTGISK